MAGKIKCEIYFDDERGTLIRVMQELFFVVGTVEHAVRMGFVSDGASVPRFLWRLLSPPVYGETLGPSIIHDWLYAKHVCTRAEADAWYFENLCLNGYPFWKSLLTYIGLRLFGSSHWRQS